jgi:hypothetical protein
MRNIAAMHRARAPIVGTPIVVLRGNFQGLAAFPPRFTPIGRDPLRYNSSHVDRSAFRTLGAHARQAG